jgi:hypothetical protein
MSTAPRCKPITVRLEGSLRRRCRYGRQRRWQCRAKSPHWRSRPCSMCHFWAGTACSRPGGSRLPEPTAITSPAVRGTCCRPCGAAAEVAHGTRPKWLRMTCQQSNPAVQGNAVCCIVRWMLRPPKANQRASETKPATQAASDHASATNTTQLGRAQRAGRRHHGPMRMSKLVRLLLPSTTRPPRGRESRNA